MTAAPDQEACRVCGQCDAQPELHDAQERMFGLGGRFRYRRCRACSCLQIEEIPADLAAYYPTNYYSLAPPPAPSGLRGWMQRQRDAAAVGDPGLVGRMLLARKPHPPLQSLAVLRPARSDRILDVGCGSGRLLFEMAALGFRELCGVDPHLPSDVRRGPVRLVRARIEDLEGEFDVVMFHHSLEHVVDPRSALAAAWRRLRPGGRCLVRVPLVSSLAWERYGTDWVQLDAPRHLHLHSLESFARLATDAGFALQRTVHDSDDFQFWGSEALRRGWRLFDPVTGRPEPRVVALAARHRRRWRREAAEANAAGRGDQAIFLLRRPEPATAPR